MGNSRTLKGVSKSFNKKDAAKLLERTKAELEKEQKKREETQEYINLSREIVHHEKYLSEIRGDEEDLIEARKRLQRAKVELKKHVDNINKLKSQIGHYENVLKKAQKIARRESELWSLQE